MKHILLGNSIEKLVNAYYDMDLFLFCYGLAFVYFYELVGGVVVLDQGFF